MPEGQKDLKQALKQTNPTPVNDVSRSPAMPGWLVIVRRRAEERSEDGREIRPATDFLVALLRVEHEVTVHHAEPTATPDGGTARVGLDLLAEHRDGLLLIRAGVDDAVRERDPVVVPGGDPEDIFVALGRSEQLALDGRPVFRAVDLTDTFTAQAEQLIDPGLLLAIAEGVVAEPCIVAVAVKVDVVVEIRCRGWLRCSGRERASGEEQETEEGVHVHSIYLRLRREARRRALGVLGDSLG